MESFNVIQCKSFQNHDCSPSDVIAERNTVRDVIHEWNDIHSDTRKVVLLPVGWETHSSPEMGDRPQAIINKRVLEKCDVLVGVFWTRIGTNTGEYLSGTVEEIEKHIELGKPTMLYFSNKPVHPDSIDQDQYSKLKEFKQSCQTRGLYETYDDLVEFRQKFFRQLQLKINEDKTFTEETGEEFDTVIQSFKSPPIELSKEAGILLKEASRDPNGMILWIRGNETHIQINGDNIIPDPSRRTVAKWEAAMEELFSNLLIVDTGYKREVFEITDKGFQLADSIEI